MTVSDEGFRLTLNATVPWDINLVLIGHVMISMANILVIPGGVNLTA